MQDAPTSRRAAAHFPAIPQRLQISRAAPPSSLRHRAKCRTNIRHWWVFALMTRYTSSHVHSSSHRGDPSLRHHDRKSAARNVLVQLWCALARAACARFQKLGLMHRVCARRDVARGGLLVEAAAAVRALCQAGVGCTGHVRHVCQALPRGHSAHATSGSADPARCSLRTGASAQTPAAVLRPTAMAAQDLFTSAREAAGFACAAGDNTA